MSDAPDNNMTPQLTAVGQDVSPAITTEKNPVEAAIGMEARQMLKGVDGVPATGPIPERLHDQIVQTVAAHLQHYRIKYQFVGTAINASASVVSEVLNRKYKGDTETILRKLNSWIEDDERRRKREAPIGLYETSVFLGIRDAAVIAKQNARTSVSTAVNAERARIVLCSGPSGIGKSVGAQALYASDPNAILIRLCQRGGTDTGIISAIVEAAGWRGRPARTKMIDFVFGKLRHSGRLLIVDQAHRLAGSGYEILIDLADVCGIPILVIGTDLIRERVTRIRMGAGDIMNDQFARRVGYCMDLLRGSDGQGGATRPFFSIEEIVSIFSSDKVKLTVEAAECLQAIACMIGMGMLGQAANIAEKARYAATRRPDKTIDLRLVWAASETLIMTPGASEGWDQIKRQIERVMAANRELEQGDKNTKRAAVAG